MEIIIFDTEYLTDEGVLSRCWNGVFDPPPLLVELGAYKIDVDKSFLITDEIYYLINTESYGEFDFKVSKYFEKLTRITKEKIDKEGISFIKAMNDFVKFVGKNNAYSYGNDFMRPIIQSCYYAGIKCEIPVKQAKDIRKILLKSGMKIEEIYANSSGSLVKHFKIPFQNQIHDARSDALSIIETLRFLYKNKQLEPDWFNKD